MLAVRYFLGVVAILSTMSSFAQAESLDLDARLDAAPKTHPRIFWPDSETAALREKIAADPDLAATRDYIVASSDLLLDAPQVKREKVGKRLLGISRQCLQRVTYLASAYRLTGEADYLKRAEAEMLSAADFLDWNPDHFLDVAEMTAALAIGYDWLYNDLPEESRARIRAAIIDKGLKASFPGGWWVTGTNNWNQVCHGGMTLGALAVLEDAPDLARDIIERAIKNVPAAMAEYEPDGVYPEGASYWEYGTTYNVLLIAALQSALGSDFGLADVPGFMKSPYFYLHVTGPTGNFYNFSDCGLRGGVAAAQYWFANRLSDPSLLWFEKDTLPEYVAAGSRPGGDRVLPFVLLWKASGLDIPAPSALHWHGAGRTPVSMHRSGWDTNATFAAIKGGSPSSNHAHMDIGSFVIDMAGVRWAVDLGMQDYNSLESKGVDLWNRSQKSERWKVFRLSSLSHNTLVVNGELQRIAGDAPMARVSDDPANAFSIVDMSPVYDGQLVKAMRGLRMLDNAVLVQDEIVAGENPTTVRWGMATRAAVQVSDEGNSALLTQDGKQARLTILAPENAVIKVIDISEPIADFDAANPDTRMVTFTIDLPNSGVETLAVYFGKDGDVPAPGVIPLRQW